MASTRSRSMDIFAFHRDVISEYADYVTGHTLNITGGLRMD